MSKAIGKERSVSGMLIWSRFKFFQILYRFVWKMLLAKWPIVRIRSDRGGAWK